jgi:hypothetical protein
MKRIICTVFLSLLCVTALFSSAHASTGYLTGSTGFETAYPSAKGSVIDSCALCHSSVPATNAYGRAYAGAGNNYRSIESADSDGDGFTNIEEINALTFPGDPASQPSTPPPNKPPVANAGPDQTVTEGELVTLNGSNSSDADGTIVSYVWAQTAGPSVTLSKTTSVSSNFTAPPAGLSGTSLTFRLTVTDNAGQTASATCIVNVTSAPPANQAPVADAGPAQNVVEGFAVTLDGSNSSDPDGTIVSYAWTQTAGPAVTLSNASVMNPEFTAPSAGSSGTSLTFKLTVTDDGGMTASATCIVNVTPAPPANRAPVADAGPDQTVVEGSMVALDGSNSSDPDGTIVSYAWSQTAGPAVALSNAANANPTFTAPAATARTTGTATSLTFQLTVTDSGGLTAGTTCIVNVTPAASADQPPVADAGPDQTVEEGSPASLDGSGSTDPDGVFISSHSWTQTSGPSVTLSSTADESPNFTAPAVGPSGASLTFRLTVTDQGGLQSTDECIVNVIPAAGTDDAAPPNLPPDADAGQDQSVRSGDTVSLDGSHSSDSDDEIISYQWKQISGRHVRLSKSNSEKPTFRAPSVKRSAASLTFRLTVTDRGGLKSSDTCVVHVTGADRKMLRHEYEHDEREEEQTWE